MCLCDDDGIGGDGGGAAATAVTACYFADFVSMCELWCVKNAKIAILQIDTIWRALKRTYEQHTLRYTGISCISECRNRKTIELEQWNKK